MNVRVTLGFESKDLAVMFAHTLETARADHKCQRIDPVKYGFLHQCCHEEGPTIRTNRSTLLAPLWQHSARDPTNREDGEVLTGQ